MCVCVGEREREQMRFGHICAQGDGVFFVQQACRNHVVCEYVYLPRLCVFCRRTPVSLWPSSCSPCSCARTESPCSPEDGRSFRASECCQVNAGLAPCLCLSLSPTRHFEKWIAVALNTAHLGFTFEFKESRWLLGNWKSQYKIHLGLLEVSQQGEAISLLIFVFTDCLVSASPF